MGIETQEPEAQGTTTSFSLNQVAETQESATHPVAETQEPAIDVTQEPAIVETQEPAADVVPEIQESDAQGAATLLSLHQEAETQESVVDPIVSPQEPAIAVVTVTQEPVTPLNTPMKYQQPEPTMAYVLQENEFLRSILETYKQELVMVKEAYDKELKLYTLARIATMTEENTKENQCREYMCSQCGDIYYQTGYKVTQIPMPRASPAPMTFVVKEENPVVTQEPVGPSKIQNEPWPTTTATFEAPVFVSKAIQTLSIDEYAPPSKINTHTLVERATQTLPQPITCDAETQTQPWDEQAIMEK
jgi:hypothetical protein